jgi:hypothetical protein
VLCNTWPAGPRLSHDTLVIKVNSVDRLSLLKIEVNFGLLCKRSGILLMIPVTLYIA